VFGLKPTRYRTPHGPEAFEGWFGASCAHVVSRSVRDSALLVDVSHGHEKGSPYWFAQPERPFVEEVRRTPPRLRVSLVTDSYTGVPLDGDIGAGLDATVRLLTGLGHDVEPVTLAVDAQQLFTAHAAASGCALVAAVRDRELALGRSLSADELEPVAWHILRNAQQHSAETLYRARRTFERIGFFMEEKFDRYDVLLSPVTATLTPPLGMLRLDQPYEDYIAHVVGSVSYTVLANVSGQPSMSIPLATSRAGMPIGMMFTAGLCREGLLFQLAGQLEAAQPWAPFAPAL
jgi:Asp-tRNA(Asn)/Glu-tRNA(Gln) amidotransferase A subunit family amidase